MRFYQQFLAATLLKTSMEMKSESTNHDTQQVKQPSKITDPAISDQSTFRKGRICHDAWHVKQKFNWDCGVSCVRMLIPSESERAQMLSDLPLISEEEGFGQSTWTIDLCFLLKRLGFRDFNYTTITLGVDPGYNNEGFYARILNKDEVRVNDRFAKAEGSNLKVEKRSVNSSEIVDHLISRGPAIILVNSNVLTCEANHGSIFGCFGCSRRSDSNWWNLSKNAVYQGHYILLVGYDCDKETIIYRNPTYEERICEITIANLDLARKSYGTDEDIIFIKK